MSSSVAQLSNNLYSFEHQKGEWKMLAASPSYRYLHSASMVQVRRMLCSDWLIVTNTVF